LRRTQPHAASRAIRLRLALRDRQGKRLFGRNRRGADRGQVVLDELLFIQPKVPGVGADKSLIEDAPRELVKVFFFEGAEQAGADLGLQGDVFERDPLLFPLLAQALAKGSHATFVRPPFVGSHINHRRTGAKADIRCCRPDAVAPSPAGSDRLSPKRPVERGFTGTRYLRSLPGFRI
jgi:hypothetical protein